MSQADCKDRYIGVIHFFDLFDDLNVLLRISRAVGQHDAIRAGCEDFFCSCITGINGDFAATLCQGTGDVALTVFQSLPVDGIVIVSTPQDLVKMIVNKAFNMAKMMNVPVLGLVENMSYYVCPHCNEKISIFGESQIDETAQELGVPVLAKLPINPDAAKMIDAGRVEDIEAGELDEFVDTLK